MSTQWRPCCLKTKAAEIFTKSSLGGVSWTSPWWLYRIAIAIDSHRASSPNHEKSSLLNNWPLRNKNRKKLESHRPPNDLPTHKARRLGCNGLADDGGPVWRQWGVPRSPTQPSPSQSSPAQPSPAQRPTSNFQNSKHELQPTPRAWQVKLGHPAPVCLWNSWDISPRGMKFGGGRSLALL